MHVCKGRKKGSSVNVVMAAFFPVYFICSFFSYCSPLDLHLLKKQEMPPSGTNTSIFKMFLLTSRMFWLCLMSHLLEWLFSQRRLGDHWKPAKWLEISGDSNKNPRERCEAALGKDQLEIRKSFCNRGWQAWSRLHRAVVVAPSCWNSKSN